MNRRWAIGLLITLAAVGLLYGGLISGVIPTKDQGRPGAAGTGVPQANQTDGLVAAHHPECEAQGVTVATYLQTGSPTTLDPQFATIRAGILAQPQAAQAGLIRAQADAVITACDLPKDKADAEPARYAAYVAYCKAHHGQFEAYGPTVYGVVEYPCFNDDHSDGTYAPPIGP